MGPVADQPERLQPCLTAKKMQMSLLAVLASLLVLASTAPQGRPSLTRDRPQGRSQNQNSPNTRFFTGNQAIDSAAWGAALGAGTQYFANQVSTRAGTGAARGPATPRAPTPTTGSSATPTSTTGSSDSLEDSPLPPSLRTPVSPQTVGEQQLWVNFG